MVITHLHYRVSTPYIRINVLCWPTLPILDQTLAWRVLQVPNKTSISVRCTVLYYISTSGILSVASETGGCLGTTPLQRIVTIPRCRSGSSSLYLIHCKKQFSLPAQSFSVSFFYVFWNKCCPEQQHSAGGPCSSRGRGAARTSNAAQCPTAGAWPSACSAVAFMKALPTVC